MERRTFIAVVSGGLLAAPLAAEAQQAGKIWRVGSLLAERPPTPPGQGLWYDRMRELGWAYGQHYVVDRRIHGDQFERIPDLAAELMRSGVDIFLVGGSQVARRLQEVTPTIPIVVSDAGDLVQGGLAVSLARPGGNVTGVQTLMPEVVGKHVALLKEAIPGLSRSGVLIAGLEAERSTTSWVPMIREAETSAKALGLSLQIVTVPRVEDFDTAFSAFRTRRVQGTLVLRTSFLYVHRKTVIDVALKHRIATISDVPGFATDGGLLSYGYDLRELVRLLADTIDQIFRGAQASETPIRQVTTFRLSVNLKTAKALGLTIPPSLLQRADQVIE
jgi:putative tryptophan/tyrosine transport system substrate-binding protein